MFLKPLRERNPEFLRAIATLHAEGTLPANTYAIDLDTVTANATSITAEAKRHQLTVFGMTKQMGRNVHFCNALHAGGVNAAVAVDMDCARAVKQSDLAIGHIGHLVQIPESETLEASAMDPRYWTVYNIEKAQHAASAASSQGRTQDFLLRIYADGDTFYFGHGGGFRAEEILESADRVDALEGARFAGITSFPALLFSEKDGSVVPTHNLQTLENASRALVKSGRTIEINAPGTNSSVLFGELASHGATQVEPGHAFTGTTPLHVVREDLPELPAAAYVTEVSHEFAGKAYCFGGGFYIDPVFSDYQLKCLIVPRGDSDGSFLADVEIPSPSAIDYYGLITPPPSKKISVGDTAIFGFRIQAFVTRANIAPLRGVHTGRPEVLGLWNSFGTPSLFPKRKAN
ncbi:MAG TPA: alanine racemase [Acidimicrobiales bacterium]